MTPKARSMHLLRNQGYLVGNVEMWIPIPGQQHKVTKDLFGFADLIATGHGENWLIQVTSKANISTRIKKIIACSDAKRWLEIPTNRIAVHGWYKAKKPILGRRWIDVRREVSMADFT